MASTDEIATAGAEADALERKYRAMSEALKSQGLDPIDDWVRAVRANREMGDRAFRADGKTHDLVGDYYKKSMGKLGVAP